LTLAKCSQIPLPFFKQFSFFEYFFLTWQSVRSPLTIGPIDAISVKRIRRKSKKQKGNIQLKNIQEKMFAITFGETGKKFDKNANCEKNHGPLNN
jgi:hypothetical protein